MENIKTAIIGSGPAGLTAAIYLSRAFLNPTVFAGTTYGGQLMLTTEVENFPGFPEGIMGPELMENMVKQAKRFGTEFIYKNVTKVDFSNSEYKLFVDENEYKFNGVIIATGAASKWLNIPSEERLIGKGVSSCATCDGAFFRDKEIAVVGGGDSAMEEAVFLTKFASKVTILHRRDTFKASKVMSDRALSNPKIEVIYNTEVIEVLGDQKVEGVKLKDTNNNAESTLNISGLFIAIGHTPNTEIFKGQIELDERGYIKTDKSTQTNINGVFSAGDVDDIRYKQAITAAGEGCKAALDLEKYLEKIHG